MVFHFVQGGSIVVLLDEGFNEIEDLLLSLGKHQVEFRFTFDNSILGGRSQEKDERGELTYKRPERSPSMEGTSALRRLTGSPLFLPVISALKHVPAARVRAAGLSASRPTSRFSDGAAGVTGGACASQMRSEDDSK